MADALQTTVPNNFENPKDEVKDLLETQNKKRRREDKSPDLANNPQDARINTDLPAILRLEIATATVQLKGQIREEVDSRLDRKFELYFKIWTAIITAALALCGFSIWQAVYNRITQQFAAKNIEKLIEQAAVSKTKEIAVPMIGNVVEHEVEPMRQNLKTLEHQIEPVRQSLNTLDTKAQIFESIVAKQSRVLELAPEAYDSIHAYRELQKIASMSGGSQKLAALYLSQVNASFKSLAVPPAIRVVPNVSRDNGPGFPFSELSLTDKFRLLKDSGFPQEHAATLVALTVQSAKTDPSTATILAIETLRGSQSTRVNMIAGIVLQKLYGDKSSTRTEFFEFNKWLQLFESGKLKPTP